MHPGPFQEIERGEYACRPSRIRVIHAFLDRDLCLVTILKGVEGCNQQGCVEGKRRDLMDGLADGQIRHRMCRKRRRMSPVWNELYGLAAAAECVGKWDRCRRRLVVA